jgi:hypothetical protein
MIGDCRSQNPAVFVCLSSIACYRLIVSIWVSGLLSLKETMQTPSIKMESNLIDRNVSPPINEGIANALKGKAVAWSIHELAKIRQEQRLGALLCMRRREEMRS